MIPRKEHREMETGEDEKGALQVCRAQVSTPVQPSPVPVTAEGPVPVTPCS